MKSNEGGTLSNPLITPEHRRRKAIVYLRQSSLEQVEKNTGSQFFQRNQIDLARAYGWPDDSVEIIDDDLGKSGSSVDRRSGWQRMLGQIAANTVGVVFAANISRLGREMLDLGICVFWQRITAHYSVWIIDSAIRAIPMIRF
jgi:hypothetical protein